MNSGDPNSGSAGAGPELSGPSWSVALDTTCFSFFSAGDSSSFADHGGGFIHSLSFRVRDPCHKPTLDLLRAKQNKQQE